MIRDNELVGLCQVIARDSGMEVTVGGKKSYITDDGCRLNIAAMPMTPEGRLVAVGLGFHEVGHKLYSDISSDWGHGLQHDLTNIIEDVRETRDFIKDRPGVAYDIEKAVNWYQEAGSYTPSDLNTAIRALALGVGYVDLLGFPSLVPELALAREIISSEMGDGFLSLAEMILKKYPKMSFGKEGTAESIEMAKALCNLLEEEAKKKEQEEQGQKQQGQQQKQDDHQDQPSQGESSEEEEQKAEPSEGEDDDQNSQDDQDDQDDSNSPSESDTDEDDQNGGGGQQDEDSPSQDDGGKDGEDDSPGNGGNNSSPSDADSDADQTGASSGGQADDTATDREEGQTSSKLSPDVIREILQEESDFGDMKKMALKELDRMSKDVPDVVRAGIPQLPRSERFYGDVSLVNESDAITATSRMRAKLMGMLQSVKRQPERYGTTGRKLAVNRLVNMATGDPRIFKKRVETVSINTAVVIMLDASGSMASNNRMVVARDAAFALHHTLRGIGGVSALSAAFDMNMDHDSPPIQLLCTWGEKPAPENFSIWPGDYTPTPWALWYARAQLLQRPEQRKICLLVTDGEPYGWDGIEADTKAATRRLEKDGIEIAAIGIELPDVATYWTNNRVVNSIEELPPAMFGVMNDLLTRKP